jgi:phosphatidate cytidylyltransferase
LWGRTVGKRKLTPKISPGKTWEGLLLGSATTVCLASVLVPLLAPLPGSGDETGYGLWAAMLAYGAGAGLSIAVAGLVGDLAVSGIKRDAGVKDSGRILPGQGGILDRIDSLTLSAPAFYYYTLAAAYAAT